MATSRHLSLRLDADTFERLAAESRRAGQVPSRLARIILEEGLRMQGHPGIVFRSGPAGRRAGLAGGPDIWEVVRVYRGVEAPGEVALQRTAELMALSPDGVRIAIGYYADHSVEIDDWIRHVDEDADQAEAAWRREQDVPRR